MPLTKVTGHPAHSVQCSTKGCTSSETVGIGDGTTCTAIRLLEQSGWKISKDENKCPECNKDTKDAD